MYHKKTEILYRELYNSGCYHYNTISLLLAKMSDFLAINLFSLSMPFM